MPFFDRERVKNKVVFAVLYCFKTVRMRRTMDRLDAGIKNVKLSWSLPTNSSCEEKIFQKDISDKYVRLTARKQTGKTVTLCLTLL